MKSLLATLTTSAFLAAGAYAAPAVTDWTAASHSPYAHVTLKDIPAPSATPIKIRTTAQATAAKKAAAKKAAAKKTDAKKAADKKAAAKKKAADKKKADKKRSDARRKAAAKKAADAKAAAKKLNAGKKAAKQTHYSQTKALKLVDTGLLMLGISGDYPHLTGYLRTMRKQTDPKQLTALVNTFYPVLTGGARPSLQESLRVLSLDPGTPAARELAKLLSHK